MKVLQDCGSGGDLEDADALVDLWMTEPAAVQEQVDTLTDGRQGLLQNGALGRRQTLLVAGHRRLQARRPAAAQVDKGLLHRRRQQLRLFVAVGRKHIEAQHHIGARQLLRGAEAAAVDLDGLHHLRRRKVRGKGKRQAELGRQLRAEQAGAQNPERHLQAGARHGAHALALGHRIEVMHEFDHVLRKLVGVGVQVAPQRACRRLVGTRRSAQPEVDATRKQRLQRAELLGNHQRGMVGQHDAAGPDADARGAAGHMRHDNRRGRTGNAGHAVVLGQPVTLEAPAFGVLRQVQGVAQGLRGVAALHDGGEVQN